MDSENNQSNLGETASPAEADNVIDLRPYLRAVRRDDDMHSSASPLGDAEEPPTVKPNDIDQQVRSMFRAAAALPVPQKHSDLVREFGFWTEPGEDQSNGEGEV